MLCVSEFVLDWLGFVVGRGTFPVLLCCLMLRPHVATLRLLDSQRLICNDLRSDRAVVFAVVCQWVLHVR